MCKYCEVPNDLIFSRRKKFSICVAGKTLFINTENIKNVEITEDDLNRKQVQELGREKLAKYTALTTATPTQNNNVGK